MEILFYDACLLITKNKNINFNIKKLQKKSIYKSKMAKFIKTRFKAKSQIMLEISTLKNFNCCCIIIEINL